MVTLARTGREVSGYSHADVAVIDVPEVRLGELVKALCGRKPHHAIDPANIIGCTRCAAESNVTMLRSRFSRLVFWLENLVGVDGRFATRSRHPLS